MSGNTLRHKLTRFEQFFTDTTQHPSVNRFPERYHRLSRALGGELVTNHTGCFLLKETRFPFSYRHGQAQLGPVSSAERLPLSAFSYREVSGGSISLSSLLFIDTETTGLGGAGTVAFLVGCGSVGDDGFEVRQYFIPDYSDESAMLEALLQEFRKDRVLVSYNGAAFDLPVLRDRMIINRVAREVPQARHLDLLPPTRRLFKRRLRDCTLSNIERELFGFRRSDDVPGYLIPSIYFNWLSEQNVDGLTTVFEHNRLDIVSLFFLARSIAAVFATHGKSLHAVDDLHSLSRIYGRQKANHKIIDIFRRIETLNQENLAEDVVWFHSLAFKRIGDYDRAVALWEELSSSSTKEGFFANIELAKYYEHRRKDISKALYYAAKAASTAVPNKTERFLLAKRLTRLRNKLPG
jgi:hypothetical protein